MPNYDGLRRFNEIRTLDHTDEIFEVLYNLSVGLERLLKIAVVFVEDGLHADENELEKSLITHSHGELLARIKKHEKLNLEVQHYGLIALLGTFYRTHRYDRFNVTAVMNPDNEKRALKDLLSKNLGVDLSANGSIFPTENLPKYRKHLGKVVTKLTTQLFSIIQNRASGANLYTYELRSGSKADTIFRGQADHDFYFLEEVTWKEILIFFMNTDAKDATIDFLREIEPLDIDPGLIEDYLEALRSDVAKAAVIDEVETALDELENPGGRLKMLDLIANPNVDLSS